MADTELSKGAIVNSAMMHFGEMGTQLLSYIDGGTGSMLIQAALAGLLSLGFIIRQRWALVKHALGRRASKTQHP